MRLASAVARSAMKVVAVASVTVGGRRAGRCSLFALCIPSIPGVLGAV